MLVVNTSQREAFDCFANEILDTLTDSQHRYFPSKGSETYHWLKILQPVQRAMVIKKWNEIDAKDIEKLAFIVKLFGIRNAIKFTAKQINEFPLDINELSSWMTQAGYDHNSVERQLLF